jgi:hypothetical protein
MQWSRVTPVVLGGVAATAASGLIFEIALTRVFAVTQFYHFAFLTISMALLGFGASGSALTAFPRLGVGGPRRWAWLAGFQGLATVTAYGVSNSLPFDSFAIAWDRAQIAYLAVYYLTLAVPFFFGGLIVAVLLTGGGQPEPVSSHLVYGASLAGAGLGCVVAVVGLDLLGGEGTIALAAAVAMAAAVGFATLVVPRRGLRAGATVATVILLAMSVAVPGPLEMNMSPYKDLAGALRFPDATVVATVWDRGTRIDLVHSDGIRSLPGLSFTYSGAPPAQDGVTFDGDDLSPIPRLAPEAAEFAPHLLTALPWLLRPGADSLILEPRGGLDVLVALAGGAKKVVAVEPHGAVIDVITAERASVYDDSRVEVVVSDSRTFVERTGAEFDVIDLALTSPYRPVTSGAYSLAEDYSLTVEAFVSYLDRLEPNGILMVARWVQTPPSEATRLLGIAAAALRRGDRDPVAAVVVLRNYSNAVLLVQPDGWSAVDLVAVQDFAATRRFDIVTMPGLDPTATNRFSVIPDERYSVLAAELLTAVDPQPMYAGYEFDISPPTDDHPFFGHYFKWNQTADVLGSLGRTWQPFGGAGYLVLVAFLVLATLSAVVLIVAPLAVRRRARGDGSAVPAGLRWWTVGYFGLLGLAFLLMEIPLVQLYILLVGDPTTAFAVVLFAVLMASGVGSMVSPRVSWRAGAVLLTGTAVAYPFLIRGLTTVALPAPLLVRVMVGAVAITPLGFLMGIMFPRGIAYLERRAPHLVPWAWGINGTVSVISAVTAALLALAFGFSFVLAMGAVGYGLAALLAVSADRSLVGAGERHE